MLQPVHLFNIALVPLGQLNKVDLQIVRQLMLTHYYCKPGRFGLQEAAACLSEHFVKQAFRFCAQTAF